MRRILLRREQALLEIQQIRRLNGTENDNASSTTGAQRVNDNNLSTHVDTFPTTTNDYVGVTFATPMNNIGSVGLNMALFGDGGWFGPSNTTPGGGNALTAADLTAPTVQITTDGVNWTNVTATSNYVSAMTGTVIGVPNPNLSPLSTFTLDTVENGVLGIRLLGNGGGVAGDGGFIGVSEFAVNTVPEPSSLIAFAGLCGMGLCGFALRPASRRR